MTLETGASLRIFKRLAKTHCWKSHVAAHFRFVHVVVSSEILLSSDSCIKNRVLTVQKVVSQSSKTNLSACLSAVSLSQTKVALNCGLNPSLALHFRGD